MSESVPRLADSREPAHGTLLESHKDVLEKIIRGAPLADVLAALCHIVDSQATGHVVAAILLADSAGRTLYTGAAPGLPEQYNRAVDGLPVDAHLGTCCAAAARREAVCTVDIANDPGWTKLAHLPLALGLKAAWSLPILSSSGHVLGTFGTYFGETRAPTAGERQLVEVLARTAALAIERHGSDAALQASEARYRAIVETRNRLEYAAGLSGVGFWYCVLPFDELNWDDRVKEHFFLQPDARVNISDFYDRMHPEDRESTRLAIEASIRERTSYDTVYRTVDPATGAMRWIRAIGGTAFGPDGAPTHFDGVTVDVTGQRLVQERLAGALEQVREQERRKDEFLATLAHELRNPLAPIRNGLQILRVDGAAEAHARTREMMERQLGHLVHMVDDLLDISRITLGKIDLRRAPTDFRSVLDSALESTRQLVESSGHQLLIHLPDKPLPMDADQTRLAQVLANLVNNAAKFTPAGGAIRIEVHTEPGMLVARISDNGIGIPADMLTRVFDMFTQVGHSIERRHGGLGIGLTLVRRLVEMHGGSVLAESGGPGQGTAFVLRLPLLEAASALGHLGAVSDQPVIPQRILVVDDNVDAAESLAMLLQLDGHLTRTAHSGQDAIRVFGEFEADAAVLDIGLPDMSGYQVAPLLRAAADQRGHALRLIALTGWGTQEDRQRAQAAGFDHHLVKPVDPDRLTSALSDAGRT